MENVKYVIKSYPNYKNKKTKTNILIYSISIFLLIFVNILIFSLGVLLGTAQHPSVSFISKLYYRLRVQGHPLYNTITAIDSLTDPDELINIHSASELLALRDSLIHFLWGGVKICDLMPQSVIKDWKDKRWSDVKEIKRIDKITVKMEFDIASNIYHLIPHSSNGEIILFHAGHDGDFIKHKAIIAKLLRENYEVLAFCMPLLGINNQPVIKIDHVGYVKLENHDFMCFLEPRQGNPIKYFIEPVITAINYVERNYNYRRISMIGLSGGGLSTTLSAAIDPRIALSFSIAGSLPLHLHQKGRDFEQMSPKMYKKFSYLELYVMASYGERRKHFQINNQYDPVCFYGINSLTYKQTVEEKVKKLGLGEYNLFIENNYFDHAISEKVLDMILGELRK